MPYSKDIRCGDGWFEVNLNSFYQYLEDSENKEIHTKTGFCDSEMKYHDFVLSEQIEDWTNEYIQWKIFGITRNQIDEDDQLPNVFGHIWGYVYYNIARFIQNHPDWYELREIS